jgi:hypothetical protein
MRDFDDDVFKSTAKYYVQYRAVYPPLLLNLMGRASYWA